MLLGSYLGGLLEPRRRESERAESVRAGLLEHGKGTALGVHTIRKHSCCYVLCIPVITNDKTPNVAARSQQSIANTAAHTLGAMS